MRKCATYCNVPVQKVGDICMAVACPKPGECVPRPSCGQVRGWRQRPKVTPNHVP